MKRCDICGGSGTIRLPIQCELSVVPDREIDLKPVEAARQYACPECSTGGPISNLQVIGWRTSVRGDAPTKEFRARLPIDAVRAMAEEIVRSDLLKAEVRENSDWPHDIEYNFTLGLVSPKHVADLKARIQENGGKLADAIASTASRQIDRYGSESGLQWISKGLAKDIITRAAKGWANIDSP